MADLLTLTDVFLTGSTILIGAFSFARTEPLKTGLSILGLATAALWFACGLDIKSSNNITPPTTAAIIGTVVPGVFIAASLVSLGIHGRLWWKEWLARIPQFGTPEPGETYVIRRGAYALIHNSAEEIALVRTPGGIFLPGGGRDQGESLHDALVREVLEECGLRIRVGPGLGTADELCIVRGEPVRKRCAFFEAALDEAEPVPPTEPDHELLWVAKDKALDQLTHGSQKWALRQTQYRGIKHVG